MRSRADSSWPRSQNASYVRAKAGKFFRPRKWRRFVFVLEMTTRFKPDLSMKLCRTATLCSLPPNCAARLHCVCARSIRERLSRTLSKLSIVLINLRGDEPAAASARHKINGRLFRDRRRDLFADHRHAAFSRQGFGIALASQSRRARCVSKTQEVVDLVNVHRRRG